MVPALATSPFPMMTPPVVDIKQTRRGTGGRLEVLFGVLRYAVPFGISRWDEWSDEELDRRNDLGRATQNRTAAATTRKGASTTYGTARRR